MEKKFIGYHGTNKANVSSILSSGFKIKKYSFVSSVLQDIPGDLGAGVYAYHESKVNAQRFGSKFGKNISVLELKITVNEKNFLDMDENSSIILSVYENPVFTHLKNRYERSKGARNRECLDGLILEHIINKHRLNVDLVKKETYTRFEGMPPTSNYYNGVELCVRNSSVIKEVLEVK